VWPWYGSLLKGTDDLKNKQANHAQEQDRRADRKPFKLAVLEFQFAEVILGELHGLVPHDVTSLAD